MTTTCHLIVQQTRRLTAFFEFQLKSDGLDVAREVDDTDPTRMSAVELWETADARTAYPRVARHAGGCGP